MGCVGWCPEPAMCREAGGCELEAQMMYEDQRREAEAAAYAEAMEELYVRELGLAEVGHCWIHDGHALDCEDCIAAARWWGLYA